MSQTSPSIHGLRTNPFPILNALQKRFAMLNTGVMLPRQILERIHSATDDLH